MLQLHNPTPSPTCQDREARILALLAQLRPAADQALRLMVETLVDAPDSQLLRDVEVQLRDHAHDLAAAVQQTGLADRKKGGTKAPASAVPSVPAPPSSSTTCPVPSTP